MCDCDCERPEFYSEAYTMARKPHRCSECRITILPGRRYWRCTGKWNGDVETHHVCTACQETMKFVAKETGHCVCFTELAQELIYLGYDCGSYSQA